MANVNLLISQGHSFSGHEKNCAFLNMRDGRFATISAVAGFDFPDDARAVAVTDWDRDGDLDAWLSNRTAPRLRLLLNQTEAAGHSIAVRLIGVSSNRDGVGARVMVWPRDAEQPLIATCRAGDGFLSQSSRWLQFGLADNVRVDRVEVTWPSGQRDVVKDLAAGRRYEIREGLGKATPVLSEAVVVADFAPAEIAAATESQRIALTDPIPIPKLPYRDASGADQIVDCDHVTLVTLWASWCGPCIRELREFTASEKLLREAGVQVAAICVDQQAQQDRADLQLARQIIDQTGFPFVVGYATEETVTRIHTLLETPFNLYLDVATPTSILIDDRQRLIAIYRGPATVQQVISDAKRLPQSKFPMEALPLAGKWFRQPPPTDVLRIPREMVDREQLDDAIEYVLANEDRLAINKEFSKLVVWIGDELVQRRDNLEALRFYQMALRHEAEDYVVMNNVAWQLATNPDRRVRNGRRAVQWARRAAELTDFQNPYVLATLAVSYAEAGQFDKAFEANSRALELAKQMDDVALRETLQQRVQLFQSGKPYRAQ